IVNSKGQMLLQRRAHSKYHGAGLWSNACCTHPRADESYADCAHRRLQEELGFDCALTPAFSFIYRAEVENGLIEHELDHVFIGRYEGKAVPNPLEVEECTFVALEDVRKRLKD